MTGRNRRMPVKFARQLIWLLPLLGLYPLLISCNAPVQKENEKINRVSYHCPSGAAMTAIYLTRPPKTAADGRPDPQGSVRLSLDDGPTITLQQTLSASGIRYANADETLVFWSKGKSAFVMRAGKIDPHYKDCEAP